MLFFCSFSFINSIFSFLWNSFFSLDRVAIFFFNYIFVLFFCSIVVFFHSCSSLIPLLASFSLDLLSFLFFLLLRFLFLRSPKRTRYRKKCIYRCVLIWFYRSLPIHFLYSRKYIYAIHFNYEIWIFHRLCFYHYYRLMIINNGTSAFSLVSMGKNIQRYAPRKFRNFQAARITCGSYVPTFRETDIFSLLQFTRGLIVMKKTQI